MRPALEFLLSLSCTVYPDEAKNTSQRPYLYELKKGPTKAGPGTAPSTLLSFIR